MKNLPALFTKYKWYLLFFIVFVIGIPLVFFLARGRAKPPSSSSSQHGQVLNPTPTAFSAQFRITQTSPTNGATNVPAGETLLSFTTDTDLPSDKVFRLDVNPKPQYGLQMQSTFPTNVVNVLPLGGLHENTTYTITVSDQFGKQLTSWTFLTAPTPAQSHSATRNVLDQETNAKYYPLTQYLPYSTADFTVSEYTDHLTLKVLVNTADLAKVKTEVNDWIRSKGVDPNTHTINYVNNY